MDAKIHAFPPAAGLAERDAPYRHRYIVLVGLSLASWGAVLVVGKLIIHLI
jgi:hypothetical protein